MRAADMAYDAARRARADAVARRDTRRQHEAEADLRRAMTARLRAEAQRPQWRRLLDAWRGKR